MCAKKLLKGSHIHINKVKWSVNISLENSSETFVLAVTSQIVTMTLFSLFLLIILLTICPSLFHSLFPSFFWSGQDLF